MSQVFPGFPHDFQLDYNYWLVKGYMNVLPSILYPDKANFTEVSLVSSVARFNGDKQDVTVTVRVHVRADDFVSETVKPTISPTKAPVIPPTAKPTFALTASPTRPPTRTPTMVPTLRPTARPTTATPTKLDFRLPGPQHAEELLEDGDSSRRQLISTFGCDTLYTQMTSNYKATNGTDIIATKIARNQRTDTPFKVGGYSVSSYNSTDTVYAPTPAPTAAPSTGNSSCGVVHWCQRL
jgi:hypothetical protein